MKNAEEKKEPPAKVFFTGFILGVIILIIGIVVFIAAVVFPVAWSLRGWK